MKTYKKILVRVAHLWLKPWKAVQNVTKPTECAILTRPQVGDKSKYLSLL